MKRLLITHTDLDGLTCGIIGNYYMNMPVIFAGYKSFNKILKQNIRKYDEIYIADIALEGRYIDIIKQYPNKRILWFDHHRTNIISNKYINTLFIDYNKCGAMIFYEYILSLKIKQNTLINYLLYLTNDYDMWKRVDIESIKLAKVVNILGVSKLFYKFIKNLDKIISWDNEMIFAFKKAEEEIKDNLDFFNQNKISFIIDNNLCEMGIIHGWQSEIGEILKGDKILIFVNLNKYTISLRADGLDVDLSQIARKHGGGGHKSSAGFLIKEDFYKKILNNIKEEYFNG